MWRELVLHLRQDCKFAIPASDGQLVAVERALGAGLPGDLRALLLESDGVDELVWPARQVEADNLFFRSHAPYREIFMPFDHLLFFADAGNGDMFAYAVLGGEVRRPDIFTWNHEDDSRRWVAPSLEKYLDWWLSGQIKL